MHTLALATGLVLVCLACAPVSGGDTGTVDPSCGALSTAPSCQ